MMEHRDVEMLLPLVARALKNSGSVTPEQIQAAVDQYLTENPVSGMTEEQVTQLNQATEDILTKVDKDQGTENAGKVLGIGSDGMVTPVEGTGGGSGGTTNYNDLTNKPTINGVEVSGNKTSTDYKISADVTAIDHGTADTTFTLPPNQYHTWGEVAALTLTLAAETTGVVNGYWFSFDSGDTATTLSLPDTVQTDIVVEPNTHYECMIVNDYMTFYDWEVSA